MMELLFLSSAGPGDRVALTPVARSLAMIESFAGVMHLALAVSRLSAMTVAKR